MSAKTALQIDVVRDVAGRCAERLAEAGYVLQPASHEETIRAYVGVRHRRVRARPRRVHKAGYTVPPHRADGEQQFLAKVSAGNDLWPHQSRKIERSSVEDAASNDFGIQHFHLGTGADRRRPNLIQGTPELLFAVVRDDDFYVIGIYDHEAWSKKELMDVVHATWPSLTDPYTIRDSPSMRIVGLRRNYDDDEVSRLREAHVNVLQQRPDGKIQIGMGGGIASDGSSVRVTQETDSFMIHLEGIQTIIVDALAGRVASGALPPDAPIRILWVEENVYAVPEPAIVKVNLTGRLMIPPL